MNSPHVVHPPCWQREKIEAQESDKIGAQVTEGAPSTKEDFLDYCFVIVIEGFISILAFVFQFIQTVITGSGFHTVFVSQQLMLIHIK